MGADRGIEFDPMDPGRKYGKAVPGLMLRIRDLYEALASRFGERGIELIRDVSTAYGRRAGEAAKSRVRPGTAGVGAYVVRVFDIVGGDWRVTRNDADEMVIEVSKCPYPFTRDDVCLAHTSMEKALVETLDPDLEYYIRRSIPRGDPVCEHVIRRRSRTSAPPESAGPD